MAEEPEQRVPAFFWAAGCIQTTLAAEVVRGSFLSYVEVHQAGRWGWRRRLGTRAMERPKAVSMTRLAGSGACPG